MKIFILTSAFAISSLYLNLPGDVNKTHVSVMNGKSIFQSNVGFPQINNFADCSLAGHWKGKYGERHAMDYDYDLFLIMKSPGLYVGYAHSRGVSRTYGNSSEVAPKEMTCKIKVEAKDDDCDSLKLTEYSYFFEPPHQNLYWPLKLFNAYLSNSKNKLKIIVNNNKGLPFYDLDIAKVSDSLDSYSENIIKSFKVPKVELKELSFISEMNRASLGNNQEGRISFTVHNISNAPSPPLTVSANFFNDKDEPIAGDKIAIRPSYFGGTFEPNVSVPGTITIKQFEKIQSDSVKIVVTVSSADNDQTLVSQKIVIPEEK